MLQMSQNMECWCIHLPFTAETLSTQQPNCVLWHSITDASFLLLFLSMCALGCVGFFPLYLCGVWFWGGIL